MEDEMISTQTKEKISDLFIDYLNRSGYVIDLLEYNLKSDVSLLGLVARTSSFQDKGMANDFLWKTYSVKRDIYTNGVLHDFLIDVQPKLQESELLTLLKPLYLVNSGEVIDFLIKNNKPDISEKLLTKKNLQVGIDYLIEVFSDLKFSKEQEESIFNICIKMDSFANNIFQNKVFKMVNNHFSDPEKYTKSFYLIELGANDFTEIKESYITKVFLDKKRLNGFNQDKAYYLNDIHQVISNGLNQISTNKEILKFEEYSLFPLNKNEQYIEVHFINSGERPDQKLITNILNDYMRTALSKNDRDSALSVKYSDENMAKVILDTRVPELTKNKEKLKI